MSSPGERFSLVADRGEIKSTPLNFALNEKGAMLAFLFRDDTKRGLGANCEQ
jgi:hypothetical protein